MSVRRRDATAEVVRRSRRRHVRGRFVVVGILACLALAAVQAAANDGYGAAGGYGAAAPTAEPVTAAPAAADEPAAPATLPTATSAPPADAAAAAVDGSGDVAEARGGLVVVVEARRQSPDGAFSPLADAPVRLHLVATPHRVVRSLTGTTGADGLARFELAPEVDVQAYAEVTDGRRYFSQPVDASSAGERRAVVTGYETIADASIVKATSMHTVVELWEGFVTFTQVWELTVDRPAIYVPTMGNPASFAPFPMPRGAEGIHVSQPEGMSRVTGEIVWIGSEVAPPDVAERPARLVVQFSLPLDGESITWEQPLTRAVDRVVVAVPQTSAFPRFPTLPIDLDVPRCDTAGGAPDGAVCFDTVGTDAAGLPLREGVDVVMAGGAAIAGQTLRVTTHGWPVRFPWERWLAGALAAVVVLTLAVLWAREPRGGDERALRRQRLLQEQERALSAARAAAEAYAAGELTERDHAAAREQLRQRLGVVARRLRELDGSADA